MSTSWQQARTLAADLRSLRAVEVALSAAAGLVLASDVVARTDLPPFTASAMDGWVVCGPPPWSLRSEGDGLVPGTAAPIVTGGPVPEGADAVLRSEHGEIDPELAVVRPIGPAPLTGADLRVGAVECRAGDVVAPRGSRIVPAVLGLAAAAGADTLTVIVRPIVDLLVVGDELLDAGPAHGSFVRDALGPMLPSWLGALGAEATPARRVPDTSEALAEAIAGSSGDLIVTTGSTASGPRDHLHPVLAELGAQLLADGVDVRPGHPMLLARLVDGRPLVGLPGNPLAAVSGVMTLVRPAVRALAGLGPDPRTTTRLTASVTGHPRDVRLIPVRGGTPVHHVGPAMLRGLASADALAVVPPGGARAGDEVELLPLP
jgi:molybdopterin molybdotransferase